MATLKNTTVNDTGFLTLPNGTLAQRPSSPTLGMMRYNSTIARTEVYNGSLWIDPATNAPVDGAIVTSGLGLYYDFGNADSYYPSRQIVYDISGNNRHGRFGAPTINLLPNPTQQFNGGEFTQYYDLRPMFEANGLLPYSLSFDARADVPGYILWYMQNGSYTKYSFVSTDSLGITTSWTRYKIENVTPAGPTSAWLQNSPSDNRAMLASYTIYGSGRNPQVRNMQLELGAYSTPFVDGMRTNNMSWSSSNGGSLAFTGLNTNINAGSINLQQNFTLEVWARMTDSTSFGIFGQGITAINQGLHILYNSGSRGMVFGMYGNDNDYGDNYRPSDNVWYHWVFTYNNSTFAKQFYANAVLQTPSASVQNQYTGSGQFNVGSTYGIPIYSSATGNIAIARMYNRVLSQSEITQNFNSARGRYGI
jgi:hypothetical protein